MKIYALSDEKFTPNELLFASIKRLCNGGASMIQYRNKSGSHNEKELSKISEFCASVGVSFIINDDALLAILLGLYEANGIMPHITQIHAGLECGVLGQRLRELQKPNATKILSIGPTIEFPHSTKERLNLESLRAFVAILQGTLQALGARV